MANPEEGHECPKLPLIINQKEYDWKEQYITKSQIKELAGIKDSEVFLAIEDPWEDEDVHDEVPIDLARSGVEHFYTGKKRVKLVTISINKKDFKISKGEHSAKEIKKLGEIPEEYELRQLVDKQFILIADDSVVLINGCEIFIGHVKSGRAS